MSHYDTANCGVTIWRRLWQTSYFAIAKYSVTRHTTICAVGRCSSHD